MRVGWSPARLPRTNHFPDWSGFYPSDPSENVCSDASDACFPLCSVPLPTLSEEFAVRALKAGRRKKVPASQTFTVTFNEMEQPGLLFIRHWRQGRND